jgi:hypothetical protein
LGIAEDFEGLKSKWSSFSILTKASFLASLILSCLSIASLADHIFKLKGFILEGVRFWSIITNHFVDFFSFLNITVHSWQIDFWVVIGLVYIPYLSVRWSVLNLRLKLQNIFLVLTYILFPFYVNPYYGIGSALFIYFSCLILCFLPPKTNDFLVVGLRGISPPIVVGLLAAISEGLSRVPA